MRTRRALMIIAATTVGAALAVALAGPASAHNYRVSSTPEPGETMTALPAKFGITTNGVLLNMDGDGTGFGFEVTDAGGKFYGDGCITVAGASLTTTAQLGAAGEYRVTWQAISTDGHTVSDTYTFSWQPPAGFSPSPASAVPPDCHGTHRVSAAPKATESATSANGSSVSDGPGSANSGTVDSSTLDAVLWICGAILAIGLAVILTLVFDGKRRGPSED